MSMSLCCRIINVRVCISCGNLSDCSRIRINKDIKHYTIRNLGCIYNNGSINAFSCTRNNNHINHCDRGRCSVRKSRGVNTISNGKCSDRIMCICIIIVIEIKF